MKDKRGDNYQGELCLESDEAKAQRILSEELARLGWSQADLARRHQSDPAKLALAARLRNETTLSLRAIAARVQLGTSYTSNKRLHEAMKALLTPGSASQHSICTKNEGIHE